MQAERRTIKLAWNCSSEAQLILFKDIANREKNNQACLELFFRGAAYLIQRYCKSREEQSSLLGIVLPRRSLSYSKILCLPQKRKGMGSNAKEAVVQVAIDFVWNDACGIVWRGKQNRRTETVRLLGVVLP